MREGMQGKRREGRTNSNARENRFEVYTCVHVTCACVNALLYTCDAWFDAPAGATQLRWILPACDAKEKTRKSQRGRQTSKKALV